MTIIELIVCLLCYFLLLFLFSVITIYLVTNITGERLIFEIKNWSGYISRTVLSHKILPILRQGEYESNIDIIAYKKLIIISIDKKPLMEVIATVKIPKGTLIVIPDDVRQILANKIQIEKIETTCGINIPNNFLDEWICTDTGGIFQYYMGMIIEENTKGGIVVYWNLSDARNVNLIDSSQETSHDILAARCNLLYTCWSKICDGYYDDDLYCHSRSGYFGSHLENQYSSLVQVLEDKQSGRI